MNLKQKRRSLYAFISNCLLRKPYKTVMLGVTYRCQCTCVHCSMGQYKKEKDRELSLEDIKKVIDQIAQMRVVKLILFGGEPLLRRDIEAIAAYAAQQGIFVQLDTNGIAVASRICTLKDAGVNHLFVSLDSSDAAIHDRLRKTPGTYCSVMDAIAACRRFKLPFSLSSYATKTNLRNGDLKKIYELAREKNALGLRILCPTLAGNWQGRQDLMLTDGEMKMLESYLDGFAFLESEWNFTRNRDCSALNKFFFYLSPYGEVQPCCFVPVSFGNVHQERLSDILDRMWSHELFRRVSPNTCLTNSTAFRKDYADKIDRHGGNLYPA